jgi:hypothetical protein
MSSFGRFTQALGGVVESLSYASPTLTLIQSVGSSPLTATIPSGGISGSGTINYFPIFTASSTIGNSILGQIGENIILNGKYFVATDSVFTGYFGKSSELISSTSASDLGIFSPNGINFGTGSSNLLRMRITETGNVLVGTSIDSGYKLNINGDIIANGIGQIYLNAGDIRFNSNAGYGIVTANGNRIVSIQNSALNINGSVSVSNNLSTSDRLWLNGNVAISSWLSNSLTASYSSTGSYGWVNSANELRLGVNGNAFLSIASTGYSTFSGAIAIGNNVASSAPDINTHKVEIEIGGNTYYLLATENA